jgi:fatty-acyl-CoA synthase
MRAIDYFDKGAEASPDRAALVDGEISCSYRQARAITERIARAMWAHGLRGEQCAAIFSQNDARVLCCMLGIMRAGAVWVPINYRNAIDANVEYMNYAKMTWLFYHSDFKDSVEEFRARVPSLRYLICIDCEDSGNPSLETFMDRGQDGAEIDWGDPRGNLDRLVGLVPRWHNRTRKGRTGHKSGLGNHDGDGLSLLALRGRGPSLPQ